MSLIGKKLGNYEITQLIGRGGMGAVYCGVHPIIGRKVAIKVLHPEMVQNREIVQRFFNEARAANDIGHPHIIDVLDLGHLTDEGNELVYLVMELLEGESLKQRQLRKPLTPGEMAHVLDQMASALGQSHAKHILHRDLKPDNVFVLCREDDPLFVKVLDFGIAKLLDQPQGGVTRAGMVLGTPEYMSPEQCEGTAQIDGRTDIYALGVILYELLAGRPPFIGGLREVLLAQMTTPPPPPSTFNPAADPTLTAIAMRCLAKDRNQRFQSMEELRSALRQSSAAWRLGPVTPPAMVSPLGDASTVILPAAAAATPAPTTPQPIAVAPTPPPIAIAPTPPPIAVAATASPGSGEMDAVAAEVHSPVTGTMPKPQPQVPGSAKRRTLWIGLSLAFLGLAGSASGLTAWWLHRHPTTPTVQATGQRTTERTEHVIVQVNSDPAGATVTRADTREVLGTTPLRLYRLPSEAGFTMLLSLPGYETERLPLQGGGRAQWLFAALRKTAPVAAPPSAPAVSLPAVVAAPPPGVPQRPSPPPATSKPAQAKLKLKQRPPRVATLPPAPRPSSLPAAQPSVAAPPAQPVKPSILHNELPLREYVARPVPAIPQAARLALRGTEQLFVGVVCAEQSGRITSVRVLQGIIGADAAIRSTIMKWRLKPQPVPLCYPVRLSYSIE